MHGYGDFAYFYDELTSNAEYEKRCDYICSLLNEAGKSSGILLDLACGTGTLSLMLKDRGYEVIGVDASEDMLTVAQEKKCEVGDTETIFLCQKMQELDLFGTIDAAVCTLDSINHVTDEEDVKEIFRRVSLFMNDSAVFVFDVNTPYKHEHILGNNTFVYDLDDVFCVWQNTFIKESCTTEISLDIFEKLNADYSENGEDGECYSRYSEQFSERGYDLEKLKSYLEEVKFEVLGVYDEFTKDNVTDKTGRAVFVCRKHGTQFI